MVNFLLKEFENTPIYVVLTTHIRDEEGEKRVLCRNQVAKEIAKEYNLPIIDLYSVSLEADNLLSQDGVHMLEDGYVLLAKEIVRVVCLSES